MYCKLTRLITLIVLLICLPLQGVAAVVMPACQSHGQSTEMHANVAHVQASDDCNHHSVNNSVDCDHPHDKAPQSKKSPCDKCFSCYLSATQAVSPQLLSIDAFGVAVKVAASLAGMSDALPSPLYHPPRSTFA